MGNVQPLTSGQTVTPARTPKSTLGKDDFLNLLVTQMQHQDPLDPMKGTEFAAQLAQFSSLEQLTNINSNLTQSLTANAFLASSINNALAATFIGKEVRASASSFQYNNTGNVKLGYSLSTPASSVTVKIYDGAGNLVKTLAGSKGVGENNVTWDGTDENGQRVGTGNYTFKVDAADSTGASIDAKTYVFGKVSGVRFKPEGTVFVIDDVEISLANILEIMQG
ncbi:MAG: flagellar hook capping protein [Ignavibacteriales bacterium]|nr:flagellar hook capping protein [Ignavibacteriales bacterium]